MIARFCVYGLLKDLRFFEPFLILALHARGLDFAAIGVLIAVREATIACCELPTGALADAVGRRRCMIASMACACLAFVVLAAAGDLLVLGLGMVAFGLAEAFRSGTHKALIFAWLQREGRTGERTRIYGLTRAWSRLGMGISALAAPFLVWADPDYRWLFWASCLPALVNLINLASYPRDLDHPAGGAWRGICRSAQVLSEGIADAWRRPVLRRLLMASAAVEGCHDAVKGYLQPLLRQAALGLPVLLAADGRFREALLVGAGGAVVALSGALASQQAHRLEIRAGGSEAAASAVAASLVLAFLLLGAALAAGWWWIGALGFVVLAVLQNLWRPLQLARLDDAGEERLGATTLSIEAQLKALATVVLAPAFGWAIDAASGDGSALWPLVAGALVCAIALRRPQTDAVAAVSARPPGPGTPTES